jgi:hypothetical protein
MGGGPVDPVSIVTGSTAIARTPGGAGIAYVDVASGLLKYAEQNAGGMWIVQPVTVAGGRGLPVAARRWPVARDQLLRRHAGRSAAGAEPEQLVVGFGAGRWVRERRRVFVADRWQRSGVRDRVYDFANADLRYARSVGAGWMVQTIDGATDRVGRFASAVALAGNPDDHVGIAYYDQTHGDLKYALELGGVWNTMTVDGAGDAGGASVRWRHPVPADTAGIAYADRTNGDLGTCASCRAWPRRRGRWPAPRRCAFSGCVRRAAEGGCSSRCARPARCACRSTTPRVG